MSQFQCAVIDIHIGVLQIAAHIRQRVIPCQIHIIPFSAELYLIPCMKSFLRASDYYVSFDAQTGHDYEERLSVAVAHALVKHQRSICRICIIIIVGISIDTVFHYIIVHGDLLVKVAHAI